MAPWGKHSGSDLRRVGNPTCLELLVPWAPSSEPSRISEGGTSAALKTSMGCTSKCQPLLKQVGVNGFFNTVTKKEVFEPISALDFDRLGLVHPTTSALLYMQHRPQPRGVWSRNAVLLRSVREVWPQAIKFFTCFW